MLITHELFVYSGFFGRGQNVVSHFQPIHLVRAAIKKKEDKKQDISRGGGNVRTSHMK